MSETRCGFIGLIGRPNVGKSTLLNQILGQKISITTPKPQTTRNRILGIKTVGSNQMIFVDTPGIHEKSLLLNQRIVEYAYNTLQESDANLFLVEPIPLKKDRLHPQDEQILEKIGNKANRTIVIVNKIDRVPSEVVLRSIKLVSEMATFTDIIPISATKGANVDRILEVIPQYLPESPFYYLEDQITDVTERFVVAELIREQLFMRLSEELPYSTAVQIENFKESSKKITIDALIFVERESQKGMVIGKNGQMLKEIGTSARSKIEVLLGNHVYLNLHVKVLKKWTSNPSHLNELGLE